MMQSILKAHFNELVTLLRRQFSTIAFSSFNCGKLVVEEKPVTGRKPECRKLTQDERFEVLTTVLQEKSNLIDYRITKF